MTSTEQDLVFLKEALPQVQEYLLSNELYWPLSGSLPRLTPGAVLLALACVGAAQPVEGQKLRERLEIIRKKWRAAWEKKAAREVANRLQLWSQFVSDYAGSPERSADSFPAAARGRAILQLLLLELPESPENERLSQLDGALKAHLLPARFLWDASLEIAFPRESFWFLYGTL